MRIQRAWIATMFVLAAFAGCQQQAGEGPPAATSPHSQPPGDAGTLSRSYRFARNGWIFVHLEGSPGTVEDSPRGIREWDWQPYFPGGTVQAKVMDAAMAGRLEMWVAMGRPCAGDFKAEEFLQKRPEFSWMKGLLRDMKSEPWTVFSAGMKGETR